MRKTSLYLSIVILNLFSTSLCSAVTVLDPSQRRVDQPAPTPPNPIVVDNAKRLLADNWVVESMSGLNRTLHPVKKHPQNPIFKPEKPWEKPAVLLFGAVMYDPQRDEDKFRMWYLCFTPQFSEDFSQRKNKNGRIAYAISRDGINWKRPNLGIHDYGGSKENNIVITGAPDSTSIIYDPLDPDPKRRYKAHIRNAGRHLAYFSPDGIHWTEHGRINIDGHDRSTVHWDPLRRHWFATTKSNYKTARGNIRRGRGYQQSKDFLHWGPVSFLCATPESAPDFVYNLEPFYYESLFLGIWGRYTAEPDALLDIQLAVSHNGRHWERPSLDPWIPLTPLPKDFRREKKPYITPFTGVDPRDPRVPWDHGNNSGSALGPVRVGDQLWMYYSGRRNDHRSRPHLGAIGLGTLRLDGFFSLDAGKTEGTLLTRPMRLVHKTLHVNANVAGGQLCVEIVDPSGKPIPPFTRKNCVPVTTDSVRHQIQWKGAGDLSPVLGKTVRLRFTLKNTELYAFWTGQEHRWHSPDTTTWKRADTIVAQATQPTVRKQPIQEKLKTDRSLFPKAYGVLTSEKLMYPVDMSDWPVEITTERQLFVDDYLIATRSDLSRQLHQAKRHTGNPVLRLWENPWEQSSSGALIVRRDEKTGMFRMWYGMRHYMPNAENGLRYRAPTCYATSTDGVHWEKPNLGIFKFGKDKNNNICLPQGAIEGLFYHPKDPDPDKRYKALVWHDPRGQKAYAPREGFYLYWSPDGIHWQGDNQRCIMPMGIGNNFPAEPCTGVGDSTNFQWDTKLKKYVANTKIFFSGGVGRTGARCESDDLIHWGRPRMVLFKNGFDDPDTEMYERTTFPYESMWIGPTRVMHGKKSEIPKPPIRDVRPGWKQVAVELTASRDGRNWTRVCPGQTLIPLGVKGSWDADYLNGPDKPLLIDDELWFYYQGAIRWERYKATGQPNPFGRNDNMHIGLVKLRRDGFVSLNAGDKPGTVVTRPLTFEPGTLHVNAEIADGGYLKAELRDAAGTVIKPYSLADCKPVTGDVMKAAVKWAGASELMRPQDQSLRLVFQFKNAKLYSFWIE